MDDDPCPPICGDTTGPHGVGGECVLPPGHPHLDGIGGVWPPPVRDTAALDLLREFVHLDAHDHHPEAYGYAIEQARTLLAGQPAAPDQPAPVIPVAEAIQELRSLTRCSCEAPYPLKSGRHDPRCLQDYREEVETLVAALNTLEDTDG